MRKLALLGVIWSLAADAQKILHDLTEASLQDLLNIEGASMSKKQQKQVTASAAIYVINQEAIRRSGLTSIPEILRIAPGLDVVGIDGNRWAVSSRGYNSQFSNKMLVLLDGRSVCVATNSGVYWNELETMVEDIDRIEVIRGPGATLWGSNVADTQGGLITASEGNKDHAVDGACFGGGIGKLGSYRVYSKYARRADLVEPGNKHDPDGATTRGGFRSDWNLLTVPFQQSVELPRHDIVWGLGFRGNVPNSHTVAFPQTHRAEQRPAMSVPAYTPIDARLGWRLSPILEVNAGGQNLHGGRHIEYVLEGSGTTEPRGRA